MARKEPERIIYLAVTAAAYTNVFRSPVSEVALQDFTLRLVVFDAEEETIVEWIE